VILAGPASQPTSRALATLDADGAATYEFDLSWDVRGLRLAEGSAAVHIGSLGAVLAPGGEQVLRLAESVCRRGDVVTSYDPTVRPSVTPDRRQVAATVERAAASAHIVKMSDEDLAFLFPGTTLAQLAARLIGDGRPTQLLVVTKGRDGAEAVTRRTRWSAPAVPVVIVDTVGRFRPAVTGGARYRRGGRSGHAAPNRGPGTGRRGADLHPPRGRPANGRRAEAVSRPGAPLIRLRGHLVPGAPLA